MSAYPRPSPNAVIRDWLSHTEAGRQPERHVSSSDKKRTRQAKHHQRQLENVKNHKPPHGSLCQKPESGDGDRFLMEAENLHKPASFDHDTRHLAQRLGLRTPFCTLDGNQKQMDANEDVVKPRVKRKRSLSSSRSHLGPTAKADDREHLTYHTPAKHAVEMGRKKAKSSSNLPRSSTTQQKSFKSLAKPYERKSRNRTREDHYTLKDVSKLPKQLTVDGDSPIKKKGKRKRREKSGSALMHDFTARNVAFSRLTLRSAPAVGIFSKGRASSPIKRKGLPDLAFSEVSFLKSRRDKSQSLHEPLERSLERGKRGFAHDDAQISKYFSSIKDSRPHRLCPEPTVSVSPEQCDAREGGRVPIEQYSSRKKPLSPPLELPKTPFLGFGSSGLSMSSPAKVHKPIRTPHRTAHSPHHFTSPMRSTTYYTWSRTGPLSQGSLPLDSARNPSPRSGLNNESPPHRVRADQAHAVRHAGTQVERTSGQDVASRQSAAKSSRAEGQPAILDAGCGLDQAPQPSGIHARSKELPSQNGSNHNGKLPADVRNQEFLANSPTKTTLAGKTFVADLDIPSASSHSRLEKTASLKSFDAALDRLIRKRTETPSWRFSNSNDEIAVQSGPKIEEPKDQVADRDIRPSYEVQETAVLTANPTCIIEPSFCPSVPITKPCQRPSIQARRSSRPPSSTTWVSRSSRPYKHEAHRVPLSKLRLSKECVMGQAEMQAKHAWHGYDNLFKRQEMPAYQFSNGSVATIRGYTPAETPISDELTASGGHFARPYHGLNSYRGREKVGFQQSEEYSSASSNPLSEHSENLRGEIYRNIKSLASHDLFANVAGGDNGYQGYEESEIASDTRPDVGQQCPLPYCLETSGEPRYLARQDYSIFEPYVEENSLAWIQATPSHTARSRPGFVERSNRLRSDQEEEGHLAGFWKPNLLY